MVWELIQINVVSTSCQQGLQVLQIIVVIYQTSLQPRLSLTHLDQVSKGWPLSRILVPAVKHHVVDLSVAVLGLLQPRPLPHPLHHLTT